LVSPGLRRKIADARFPFEQDVVVQVRSRHEGVRARMTVLSPDESAIAWTSGWAPVSPGQAAVMYDLNNEELLCGGRIRANSHAE
jgi:tRNA U34 2-thiouridine synthase MnmA/TrmU